MENNNKTGSRKKHTTAQIKEIFLDIYQKNLCNVSKACKITKVSRSVYYTWLREDEAFKDAIEKSEIYQLEFVEDALLKKIKEGSDSSIQFYLKTRGRKYGYGIQTDITTNGENINNVTVIRLIEKKEEEDNDEDKD